MSRFAEMKSNLKYTVSRKILESFAANAYMRWRTPYQHTRYIPRCDVVVDGFPRSANTYVWFALKWTIEPKYVVRGHTHSTATIKAAVDSGKPALVLIRHPDDVVASYYQLLNGVSFSSCFDSYSTFYENCEKFGNAIYVADFKTVVADLGSVLAEFYSHFDLNWPTYVKTEENEAYISDVIDHTNRRKNNGVLREAGVARPSKLRKPTTEILTNLTPAEESARERAIDVYTRLVMQTTGQGKGMGT